MKSLSFEAAGSLPDVGSSQALDFSVLDLSCLWPREPQAHERAPPPVVVVLPFDLSDYSLQSYRQLGVDCPPSIVGSVRKRQTEFLCGRLAARKALRLLGVPQWRAPIAIGDARQPIWPTGVLGSISHVHDLALAAVTFATNHASLGIDVEQVADGQTCAALVEGTLDSQELRVLERADGAASLNERVTIAFSAKESLFKAAFGKVRRWFDFSAARVSAFDAESGCITLTMAESMGGGYDTGCVCDVQFGWLRRDTVLTFHAHLG